MLGAVQGFGEFLPISSSAHLILAPWLFGWQNHSLSFDVMLHAGTLVAVILYFWKDWLVLIREGILSVKERTLMGPPQRRLFWYLVIASVPGAIIGKLLEDKAENTFRSPLLVASALVIFGFIFYVVDHIGRKTRKLGSFNLLDSILIGISQALAIVPGVSRSGITMATGLGLGLDRESAAKFSFLLSTPIIFGATILKFKEIINIGNQGNALVLISGFITSAAAGFIAIRYLLNYVKRHTFNIFVAYRIVFGLTVILLFFLRR